MDYTELCVNQLSRREQWLRRSIGGQYFNLVHSLWFYIAQEPLLRAALDDLAVRYAPGKNRIEKMVEGQRGFVGRTLEEQAAIAFEVLRTAISRAEAKLDELSQRGIDGVASPRDDLEEAALYFLPRGTRYDEKDLSQAFHSAYIVPIVQYLQDVLTSQVTGTYLLRRYKVRVEWFQKGRLLDLCRTYPSVSERMLSEDLYAYLFDKGLSFALEPRSPSGKVDFLSSQPEGRRLIAEVKVYNPRGNKRKSYIAGGYKQIRRYMSEYLEPIGYLVIFNASSDELQFVDLDISGSLSSILFENTRVYVLVIELGPTRPASSQIKRRIIQFKGSDFIKAKGKSERNSLGALHNKPHINESSDFLPGGNRV